MAKKQHDTPMLDELETGPWPSFVTGLKRLAQDKDYMVDILGTLETSYRTKKGYWKGGTVGVFGSRHSSQHPQHLRLALHTAAAVATDGTDHATDRGTNARLTPVDHHRAHRQHHTIFHMCQALDIAALDNIRTAAGTSAQKSGHKKRQGQ